MATASIPTKAMPIISPRLDPASSGSIGTSTTAVGVAVTMIMMGVTVGVAVGGTGVGVLVGTDVGVWVGTGVGVGVDVGGTGVAVDGTGTGVGGTGVGINVGKGVGVLVGTGVGVFVGVAVGGTGVGVGVHTGIAGRVGRTTRKVVELLLSSDSSTCDVASNTMVFSPDVIPVTCRTAESNAPSSATAAREAPLISTTKGPEDADPSLRTTRLKVIGGNSGSAPLDLQTDGWPITYCTPACTRSGRGRGVGDGVAVGVGSGVGVGVGT